MVMQARKLPRLSDGYFDKNQSHSYENSSKYSGMYDRNNDKVNNENSESYHRQSSQRLKDHHEDSSKSPVVKSEAKSKESKSQSSSDRDTSNHYQTNHDGNDLEHEKRLPASEWSEHISSSGKKYYYNCKTEVSQWEKPKELIEWERHQNLSRLNYDPNRSKDRAYAAVGSVKTLRTIQQALQLTKQVTNLSQAADAHHPSKPSASPAQSQSQVNHQAVPSSATYPLNSTAGAHFSENKREALDRDQASPSSDSSTHSVRHASPTSSVSSLQSLSAGTSSLAALKPSIPSLTPSLANYYQESLISHVVGWQADHAERQANRYWEEAHNIGSLNCTQVSAELKMARALVRLAEIQATLQEQRILFLRQQIKELEEWRSSNSFMGDS